MKKPLNKEQLIDLIKIRVRRELDEENRHRSYKFFDCVTKVSISENTNPDIVKQLSDFGVVANVDFQRTKVA